VEDLVTVQKGHGRKDLNYDVFGLGFLQEPVVSSQVLVQIAPSAELQNQVDCLSVLKAPQEPNKVLGGLKRSERGSSMGSFAFLAPLLLLQIFTSLSMTTKNWAYAKTRC
jgi:hypothetical protein